MSNRYLDWLRQSEADLQHAKLSLTASHFEWSCFAAHQAAEKAIKAVFLMLGLDAWGHTLTTLVGNLRGRIQNLPEILEIYARILDKYYIPTRYPNGFDSGAPTDYYTQTEAEQGIKMAEAIIDFCRDQIDRPG